MCFPRILITQYRARWKSKVNVTLSWLTYLFFLRRFSLSVPLTQQISFQTFSWLYHLSAKLMIVLILIVWLHGIAFLQDLPWHEVESRNWCVSVALLYMFFSSLLSLVFEKSNSFRWVFFYKRCCLITN